MTVLLPDGTYAVRRRVDTLDASRFPVPSYPDAPDWTGDGNGQQRPDRSWNLVLDPAAWPLREGDRVTTPGGVTLVVRTANLDPDNVDDPTWDPVRAVAVTAVLLDRPQDDRQEQGG